MLLGRHRFAGGGPAQRHAVPDDSRLTRRERRGAPGAEPACTRVRSAVATPPSPDGRGSVPTRPTPPPAGPSAMSSTSSASAVAEPRSAVDSHSSSSASDGRRMLRNSIAYPIARAMPPTISDITSARSPTTAGSALAAVADSPGATPMT